MGKPSATRASASAIARNNIAWLIPCHRVVRKIGDSGQYRWGALRKKIILGYEGSVLSANS
jgi:AraC family transcriptional regulator of adaptative response/methylated-DNA-[protein]-cysteine methyltransferase